jgi:Transposase DDE domain
VDWCQAQGDWDLVVVERAPGMRGFSVLAKRWIVERSFAWLNRNRRLAKDYERRVQTSETLIELAVSRLLLRRRAGWKRAGSGLAEAIQRRKATWMASPDTLSHPIGPHVLGSGNTQRRSRVTRANGGARPERARPQ